MSAVTAPEPAAGALSFAGTVRRGSFDLTLRCEVRPGEILAVLGPNGAGKSTLLRAVAGLEPLATGTVAVGGSVWQGPGTWVPPDRRRAGVVFQDHRLFPHLDVRDNVAFAARAAGRGRVPSRHHADDWLGVTGPAGHRPPNSTD